MIFFMLLCFHRKGGVEIFPLMKCEAKIKKNGDETNQILIKLSDDQKVINDYILTWEKNCPCLILANKN